MVTLAYGLRMGTDQALSSFAGDRAADEIVTIGVGDVAPGFRLPDEKGREIALPAMARSSVLIFYRGDW